MDITETEALFSILEKHGVESIVLSYDGSSDSGEIHSIEFDGKVECIKTINENSEIDMAKFKKAGVKFSKELIIDCIEHVSMVLLDDNEGGWEDNEGAMGDITWYIEKKKISIEHRQRIIEFEDREHDISI
jgi:hypothetical protein